MERPLVSLKHILDYDLYKLPLFKSCSQARSFASIRQWLFNQDSFTIFKDNLTSLTQEYDINLNIDALAMKEWKQFVSHNEKVKELVYDWNHGGCICYNVGCIDPYVDYHFLLLMCNT